MAVWLIKEDQRDGRPYFTMFRDRSWMMGSHDRARCEKMYETNHVDGDRLELEEPDGYRTRLKGRRRGWRSK